MDKRFVVFACNNDEIKGGLRDIKNSFVTKQDAESFLKTKDYEFSWILDRENNEYKRFLVFTYEYPVGGLEDMVGSGESLQEAEEIVKENNNLIIEMYDVVEGEEVEMHQFSWFPAQ